MIDELDVVALTHDIPEYGLREGDTGAVVWVYKGGMGYEVEFIDRDGYTTAVLTLSNEDVRLHWVPDVEREGISSPNRLARQ